jgi:hypothetical protein
VPGCAGVLDDREQDRPLTASSWAIDEMRVAGVTRAGYDHTQSQGRCKPLARDAEDTWSTVLRYYLQPRTDFGDWQIEPLGLHVGSMGRENHRSQTAAVWLFDRQRQGSHHVHNTSTAC